MLYAVLVDQTPKHQGLREDWNCLEIIQHLLYYSEVLYIIENDVNHLMFAVNLVRK